MPDNRHLILEVIEDHKEKLGDGDYLKLCNLLKEHTLKQDDDNAIELRELRIINEQLNNDCDECYDKLIENDNRFNELSSWITKLRNNLSYLNHKLDNLELVKGVGKKLYQRIMEHLRV